METHYEPIATVTGEDPDLVGEVFANARGILARLVVLHGYEDGEPRREILEFTPYFPYEHPKFNRADAIATALAHSVAFVTGNVPASFDHLVVTIAA